MKNKLHSQVAFFRVTAWLAVLLALFAALAPAVSHAIAFTRAGDHAGVEICTSTGPQWLVAPDSTNSADASPEQKTASQVDHCPFCLLQADRLAPPPSPLAFHFFGLGEKHEAVVWQAPFYSTYFALAPPPRGPPHF